VLTLPKVCTKLSFQWLRRARKSACRLQWTLLNFLQLETFHNRAQTARKVR
jgi:hypothetical protein